MPRSGLRELGVEPVEAEFEAGQAHLLSEALALELAPEPRTGSELPQGREVFGTEVTAADHMTVDDHRELEVPGIGTDVGACSRVEPHRFLFHLW